MSSTPEELVRNVCGAPVRDLRISMINVNSNINEGVEESSMSSTQKFLEQCEQFHPTLLKNYREDQNLNKDALAFADKVFMPLWFSPSSSNKKTHPKDFEGDHRSDKLCKEMGLFATHQTFATFDNATFCAALGSKRKYDSLGTKQPELMVEEEGFTAKEASYAVERGACTTVGIKTGDSLRYIVPYKCSGGKIGVSLICGSHDFLSGSLDMLKNLNTHFNIMKAQQQNKNRNGVDIVEASIGFVGKEKKDQLKMSSVLAARLLGGSVYTYDHLCILRDIYGAKKCCAYDRSAKKEMSFVDIDQLIAEYGAMKRYYVFCRMTNSIKIS